MKGIKQFLVILLIIFAVSCADSSKKLPDADVETKVYGELLSVDEANNVFGPVFVKVEIPTDTLRNFTSKSGELMMFRLKESLIIADQNRIAIYPPDAKISEKDTFTVYHTSKVLELINIGKSSQTFVEQRDEKLTITNGIQTLEFGAWCPPYCTPTTK